MTIDDIIQLRDIGEQTTVQFKERITATNKYDIACELVAMSNTQGGLLILGINDKTGEFNTMSFSEAQEATNMLSNIASENVVPAILITTENVPYNNGCIIVATIKQGLNKPYHDNKSIIWVKQGADKRRVFDNTELAAIMMQNHNISPDATPISGTSFADLDEKTIREYLIRRFRQDFDRQSLSITELRHRPINELADIISNGQTTESLLKNLGLILPDGTLTLAALILMGTFPQRWLPVFTARCVSFVGNSLGGTQFRDKSGSETDGNALHLYNYIMSFLQRNLRQIQVEQNFNSQGTMEISATTLSELVVNAILHRSYIINAPIRIFIFDNRVEIHSPGILPDGVNTENIKHGISVPRNQILFNHGIHLLPYTGVGSGIMRAIKDTPNAHFENNELTKEFVITIDREDFPEEMIIKPILDSTSITNYDANSDTNSITNSDTNSITNSDTNSITNSDTNSITNSDTNSITNSDTNSITNSDTNSITNSDTNTTNNRLKKKDLSDKHKDIINFCSIPRTSKEILQRVNVSYQTKNIQRYITLLVENGFLEPTNPNKPNDPTQKYRRVRKNK
ncbi:MAG: putative DNA binding domain-containing protein [Bacteroidales bacterium]|nr:putative DNA binding domain-containing protein [Bacteroidales bacterium]